MIAHATTRYRMGLVGLAAVPELRVFADQRQLDETDPGRPEASGEPDPGTVVRGGSDAVHINDIIALHGPRSGPVETRWRRATVVVSRGALLSKAEMDHWNFLSARHARTSGTTSWTGLPSFFEATGGRVALETVIHPIADASLADDRPPSVSSLPIDPGEFPGVRLSAAVPAVVPVGQQVTTAGTITARSFATRRLPARDGSDTGARTPTRSSSVRRRRPSNSRSRCDSARRRRGATRWKSTSSRNPGPPSRRWCGCRASRFASTRSRGPATAL